MWHSPYAAPCSASHAAAPEGPMSTASPDTWADLSGVATHRAASSSEPYFDTASRRSRSWYAGERQPLSTRNSTPPPAASVAARRTAPSRRGSSLATPGTSSSKTVVPSGTAPPASPSAARCSSRGRSTGEAADEGEGTVKDGGTSDLEPRAAAIAAMARSTPTARRLRIPPRRVVARAGLLWVTPPLKAAWCCRHVCDSRYADDMRRLVASERARADRRGRALYGGSHPRRPPPGSDRGRHRRRRRHRSGAAERQRLRHRRPRPGRSRTYR